MARSNDVFGRDRSDDGDIPSPPNLIREWWRFDDDPPNLQRLTSREAIQERGVAELYERSRGTGVYRGSD